MVVSAILNVLYPILISIWGKIPAIVLRVFIGFAQGPLFPAVSSFIQSWVPASERAFLGTIAFGGSNLGTVTGGALTGVIIKHTGSWYAPFYAWSIVTIVWYILHLFTYFSHPDTHPFITPEEAKYLADHLQPRRPLKVPWKGIFTSPVVWALISGQLSGGIIFFLMFTNLPKYFKEVLKMDVEANAMYTALPFGLMWISSLLCAYIADILINKKIMSVLTLRRVSTLISSVVPASLILLVGYVGCRRTLAVVLFTIGIMFIGPFYCGMKVNVNDISVHYSGTIMALVNGIGSIAAILGPLLVGFITVNQSIESWQIVFWSIWGFSIVTLLFYLIFTRTDRQTWDYLENDDVP